MNFSETAQELFTGTEIYENRDRILLKVMFML